MRGTGQRPLSCCALGWRFKGSCLCPDTVDPKQVHLLPSSGAGGRGTTWCTISRVGWQCHTVLTGGRGVPWPRRPLHVKGALPRLPGPCSESSAVGWGVGQNGGSPGVAGVSTAPCGVPKDASWPASVSETSSFVFWGPGPPGLVGPGFWAGGSADSATARTGLGAASPGWEEDGPTGPGSALPAELDKAEGSTGPELLSMASSCSDRAFLDVELELETVGVARAAGTDLGGVPMLRAKASENLAKYCLTTGSCGATGGWLEARGKEQGPAAWYSAKLFGF